MSRGEADTGTGTESPGDEILNDWVACLQAIRSMDDQMQALRAVVQRQQAVLAAVKEVADPEGAAAEAEQDAAAGTGAWNRPWQDSPEGVRWREALEVLFRPTFQFQTHNSGAQCVRTLIMQCSTRNSNTCFRHSVQSGRSC